MNNYQITNQHWIEHKSGHVYLMRATGTNRYKIGMSNNPERRQAELNSGQSPYYIELITYGRFLENAIAQEKQLHQRWFYRRVKDHELMKSQEWFKLSPKEIAQVTAQIHGCRIGFSPIYWFWSWLKRVQKLPSRWLVFQLGFALGAAIALLVSYL